MLIRIANRVLTAQTRQTTTCPDGVHAYYDISYHLDDECIYTIASGALSSQPSPIAALDWPTDRLEPSDDPNQITWSIDGKPGRWGRIKHTHRELLIEAINQLG